MSNIKRQDSGKDAPFNITIRETLAACRKRGIPLTVGNEHHPAPGCWSHVVTCPDCPDLTTNGKGESKEASQASGLGEFIERFATGFIFAEYALESSEKHKNSEGKAQFFFHPEERIIRVGNEKKPLRQQKPDPHLLTPKLLRYYDPDAELKVVHLLDSNYDTPDRGIIALPFTPLEDGAAEPVYFPVALLNNLYVSNGMAAGNSRSECYSQALSEIFERYVKHIVISEGIALPDLPEEKLGSYPEICNTIASIEASGCRIWIKDASLGGQFPVICVLLLDKKGGAFASFGCSCRLETALSRTLTEMLQGRSMEQLQGFATPVVELESYASLENLESHFINSDGLLPWRMFKETPDETFSPAPWNFTGDTTKEYKHLLNLLDNAGFSGYAMETSCSPLSVCRIIVPGMSEIYPPEELLWNNRNKGSWLRPTLLKLSGMKGKKLRIFLTRLENSELPNEALISYLIGVPFPEDTPWSSLRIGELKAMTSLAILSRGGLHPVARQKLLAETVEFCKWSANFAQLSEKRASIYHLLFLLLTFQCNDEENKDYETALGCSFTREELRTAAEILSGAIRFWGLNFGEDWEETSPRHKEILKKHRRYKEFLVS